LFFRERGGDRRVELRRLMGAAARGRDNTTIRASRWGLPVAVSAGAASGCDGKPPNWLAQRSLFRDMPSCRRRNSELVVADNGNNQNKADGFVVIGRIADIKLPPTPLPSQ